MSINDNYSELIAFIREKSRIIAPDFPRINEDLEISEHLWAITSSYEGTELANSDLHKFVNWLIEKFDCNREDVVNEFHKIHGRLPTNANHIFDRYAQVIEKIRMLKQTNQGLMKRLEEECARVDALKIKIEILEAGK